MPRPLPKPITEYLVSQWRGNQWELVKCCDTKDEALTCANAIARGGPLPPRDALIRKMELTTLRTVPAVKPANR